MTPLRLFEYLIAAGAGAGIGFFILVAAFAITKHVFVKQDPKGKVIGIQSKGTA